MADKVRYAVVGAGDISQEALMPGVAHTGNSELTGVVTGDPLKAQVLAERYGLEHACSYAGYGDLLRSGDVDAVYIGLPNWQHLEYAQQALEAGIHVLLEKPSEVSAERARLLMDAAARSQAKLMVAYRLHFEPATLAALELVRSGKLGEVHGFTSHFAQMVSPHNHRATNGWDAGPVLDMGAYPINAVRNLFGSEPERVFAFGTRHADSGLGDFDDTVAVTLQFSRGRVAQFVVSYYLEAINSYTVLGTEGSLTVNPGFTFGEPLKHVLKTKDGVSKQSFPATDQFGGELRYFSQCILEGRTPEPDAEEGWLDLRVMDAIRASLETGTLQQLEPYQRERSALPGQKENLPRVKIPQPVHASKPDGS